MNKVSSSFLCIGIILAIFNLSRKIPLLINWLIITVIGLSKAGFIVFINLVESPSNPQIVLGASLSIIELIILTSIFLK